MSIHNEVKGGGSTADRWLPSVGVILEACHVSHLRRENCLSIVSAQLGYAKLGTITSLVSWSGNVSQWLLLVAFATVVLNASSEA